MSLKSCPSAPGSVAAQEIDGLARREADVGLLPVRAPPERLAEALRLALGHGHLHGLHLDLEHQLHGLADLRLGGVAANLEHHLVALLGRHGGFLGHVRLQQHGHQAFLIHPNVSSTRRSAATVMTTWSCRNRLTGSSAEASSSSTWCRLREASHSFSSKASMTNSPPSMP